MNFLWLLFRKTQYEMHFCYDLSHYYFDIAQPTHTHTHTRTPTYTRTRARTHMQVSFTLPITCVVEVLLFPYIGALTDYSPHRKNIWLTAFGLLMLTSMLIAVMWHNYVW